MLNGDYPFSQLLADCMAVIQLGTPTIVYIGCFLAAVGFVMAWFFWALRGLVDWPFRGRGL